MHEKTTGTKKAPALGYGATAPFVKNRVPTPGHGIDRDEADCSAEWRVGQGIGMATIGQKQPFFLVLVMKFGALRGY